MNTDREIQDRKSSAGSLHWDKAIVTFADVKHSLNGHKELFLPAKAVVTPLASDELRRLAVRVCREAAPRSETKATNELSWKCAQERPYPLVKSVLESAGREGFDLGEMDNAAGGKRIRWAVDLARSVAAKQCAGLIVFCDRPAVVCFLANKVAGVRALVISHARETVGDLEALAPNFAVVDWTRLSFHELRQVVRTVWSARAKTGCGELAAAIKELEQHANR